LKQSTLLVISDKQEGVVMSATAIHRHTISPDDRDAVRALVNILSDVGQRDRVHVMVMRPDGSCSHVEVPSSVMPAIQELVALLANEGEAILVDEEEEITPEEAAPLLGMSRPMVIHRIKQGDLPLQMIGTHHKLKRSDVLAFREREEQARTALVEFGEQTDELVARHGL
jgi:excisionase family DNA binding protein